MAGEEASTTETIRIPARAWSDPETQKRFESSFGCALASEASVFSNPAEFELATLLAHGVVARDPSFDGVRVIPHENVPQGNPGWEGFLFVGADPGRVPRSTIDQMRFAVLLEVDAALDGCPQAGNLRLGAS